MMAGALRGEGFYNCICRYGRSMRSVSKLKELRELVFDQPMQMATYRRVIEASDNFVQEAGHNEALSNRNRDTARA